MDTRIIVIYCICDDYLKSMRHQEDKQQRMSDAEVLTIGIVAAVEFRGNYAAALRMMRAHGYMKYVLSRSRFSRRLHAIKEHVLVLFAQLGEVWKAANTEQIYALDTFPIAVCDNWRIRRCRLYQGKAYRGLISSKKRYYYGLKVHLMVTRTGAPVEFFLTPASVGDISGLYDFDFDLPEGALVVADRAYNHYLIEDLLADVAIHFLPARKRNSHRPLSPAWSFLQQRYRKSVETTGSLLERLLPKSIHATSAAGFELKLSLFALALSFLSLPAL